MPKRASICGVQLEAHSASRILEGMQQADISHCADVSSRQSFFKVGPLNSMTSIDQYFKFPVPERKDTVLQGGISDHCKRRGLRSIGCIAQHLRASLHEALCCVLWFEDVRLSNSHSCDNLSSLPSLTAILQGLCTAYRAFCHCTWPTALTQCDENAASHASKAIGH